MTFCPICRRELTIDQVSDGLCRRCNTLVIDEAPDAPLERGGTLDLMQIRRDAVESKTPSNDGSMSKLQSPPAKTLNLRDVHSKEEKLSTTAGNNDETVYWETDQSNPGVRDQAKTFAELGEQQVRRPRGTEVLNPSDKGPSNVNPRESLRLGESGGNIELPIDPPPRRLSAKDDDDVAVADYRRDMRIGKGGMGQVWATRQVSLGRTAAIKELLPELVSNPQARARFLSEASITAELEHPNIVPVHDLGIDQDGNPFYSMKLVTGQAWDKVIEKQSRKEKIDTLMRVADAIAYAHSKKVIHRDIKPENVMLGEFGEVLVMDFGLAFRLRPNVQIGSGGTLSYMAPEMAIAYIAEWHLRVQRDPAKIEHYRELMTSAKAKINEKSDIYLLGATLYEILFGAAPHTTLDEASRNTPPWPDQSDELVSVARRAMQTDPNDRYPTVWAFQDAIRTYQAHAESSVLTEAAGHELKEAVQSGVFAAYSRALVGFQEALKLWLGNDAARKGLSDTQLSYAQAAYDKGDYNLASGLLKDAVAPEHPLHKRVIKAQRGQKRKDSWLKALRIISVLLGLGAGVSAIGLYQSKGQIKQQNEDLNDINDTLITTNSALETSEQAARDSEELAIKSAGEARMSAAKARNSELVAILRSLQATINALYANKLADVASRARAEAESQEQNANSARVQAVHDGYVSTIALSKSLIDQNDSARAVRLLEDLEKSAKNFCGWEWNRLLFEGHPSIPELRPGGAITAFASAARTDRFATVVESAPEDTPSATERTLHVWSGGPKGIQPIPLETLPPANIRSTGIAISDDGRWLVLVGKGSGGVPVFWVFNSQTNRSHSLSANELVSQALAELGEHSNGISEITLDLPSILVDGDQARIVFQCYVQLGPGSQRTYLCTCVIDPEGLPTQWQKSIAQNYQQFHTQWSSDGQGFLTLENRTGSREFSRTQALYWRMNDLQHPLLKKRVPGHDITAACFVPTSRGSQLVLGLDDGRLLLWKLSSEKQFGESNGEPSEKLLHKSDDKFSDPVFLTALDQGVKGIAFDSTAETLIAYGDDRAIGLWEWNDLLANIEESSIRQHQLPAFVLRGHEGEVQYAGFLRGDTIVSADNHGIVRAGQPDQFRDRWSYGGESGVACTDGDLSSDKESLATASTDGSVRLWQSKLPQLPVKKLYVGHAPVPLSEVDIDEFVVQAIKHSKIPSIASYSVLQHELRLWDCQSGRIVQKVDSLQGSEIVISEDRKFAVTGGDGKEGAVLSLEDGTTLDRKIPQGLCNLAVSSSTNLFGGMVNGTGRLFKSDGTEIAAVDMHEGRITASAFSDDGKRLYTTGDDETLRIWAVTDSGLSPLGTPIDLKRVINRLAVIGANGIEQILAWNESDMIPGVVTLIDSDSRNVSDFATDCISLAAVSNRNIVAAIHKDGNLLFWRWNGAWQQTGAPGVAQAIKDTRPTRIRPAGDDRLLTYRVDSRGRLRMDFWELQGGRKAPLRTKMHSGSPVLLSRFVDGKSESLVTASADGVVRLWNMADTKHPTLVSQIACPSQSEFKFAEASNTGRSLILSSDDEIFHVDNNSYTLKSTRVANPSGIVNCAWAPSEPTGGRDGILAVLLRDDKILVFAEKDGRLDAQSKVIPIKYGAGAIAISKDGAFLAVSNSEDKGMAFVDIYGRNMGHAKGWKRVGERLQLRSSDQVRSLTFTESNDRIIVGDDRGRLTVWEINSEQPSRSELIALQDQGEPILRTRFTRSQKELLSMTESGEAIVWPARNDDAESASESHARVQARELQGAPVRAARTNPRLDKN